MDPMFDSLGFARELRALMVDLAPLTDRDAAAQAGVSGPTFSRAVAGHQALSHENYLRLSTWMKVMRQRLAA